MNSDWVQCFTRPEVLTVVVLILQSSGTEQVASSGNGSDSHFEGQRGQRDDFPHSLQAYMYAV
jgi:hypothetical protein